ncbi:polysaccharide deacetylase family protein [Alicyclobacillus cycloheptanicus]|uniref:Peptidoglycan/xylan/chitin deacetylase (PgdA/CDA1 family) n=2 Tax=Alicyclobacillus cycloheptanicus TaxID=1457 RepID=A0ABT9XGH2_9BACL|nr:polysaccharide deacetylase [Alicyclobacillus cycloheptanicus]MDQ0189360.1 peptidoglycan/xylan/chitin deacetylase (PgdA/CDA1 family) [Alicyclobacillus cycloheptanicus]
MHAGNICLTFDFDATSLWISRGMTTATPLSRGEFGVHALPRLLRMLAKKGIRSTWFIPGHTIDTYFEACQQIVEAGHEVALHGYLHENNATLDAQHERSVFERSIQCVERLTGQRPSGFRSPGWDLSDHTIAFLSTFGIQYDSSLMSQDYSVFYSREADTVHPDGSIVQGKTSGIVEMPISWSLDDYPHFEYLRTSTMLMPGFRKTESVYANWLDDVRYMARDFSNGVCTITLHPQVVGRGHRLLGLERFLDALGEMDMQFARMDDIVARFREGEAFGVYDPA